MFECCCKLVSILFLCYTLLDYKRLSKIHVNPVLPKYLLAKFVIIEYHKSYNLIHVKNQISKRNPEIT